MSDRRESSNAFPVSQFPHHFHLMHAHTRTHTYARTHCKHLRFRLWLRLLRWLPLPQPLPLLPSCLLPTFHSAAPYSPTPLFPLLPNSPTPPAPLLPHCPACLSCWSCCLRFYNFADCQWFKRGGLVCLPAAHTHSHTHTHVQLLSACQRGGRHAGYAREISTVIIC